MSTTSDPCQGYLQCCLLQVEAERLRNRLMENMQWVESGERAPYSEVEVCWVNCEVSPHT